jgi:hypothetical protein
MTFPAEPDKLNLSEVNNGIDAHVEPDAQR